MLDAVVANVQILVYAFGFGMILAAMVGGFSLWAAYFFVKDKDKEENKQYGGESPRFRRARMAAVVCGILSAVAFSVGTFNLIRAVQASLAA